MKCPRDRPQFPTPWQVHHICLKSRWFFSGTNPGVLENDLNLEDRTQYSKKQGRCTTVDVMDVRVGLAIATLKGNIFKI